MPGATITVTFEDREVAEALHRMASRSRDMTPVMRDIGEHLLNTTRERFDNAQAPDGTPWAPLSEVTKQRKGRGGHPGNAEKILIESGALHTHGLVYQVGRDKVEVGSPLEYAGTQQFGAARGAFSSMSKGAPIPWGDIPARPFLGLSDDDGKEIVAIINHHFERAIG